MEELFENFYRIGVPLPNNPLKEVNSYFIRGHKGEKDLLIDTGFRLEACRQVLKDGLAQLGADPANLNIFLTHCHADHAGLAPEFVSGDGNIYISEEDRCNIADDHFINGAWKKNGVLLLRHGAPADVVDEMLKTNAAVAYAPLTGTTKYIGLPDGARIRVGNYCFECLLTPGHSPGHMCLWEASCGIMLTGDCVLFDITPNITTWVNMEDSLGSYLQSLEALKAYPVKYALPGHRRPGDFQTRIRELEKHHEMRLNEAYRIIREQPGLTAYEITARMQWKIRARDWASFPNSQKFFAVGEGLAHLIHLQKEGRIRTEETDGIITFRPV